MNTIIENFYKKEKVGSLNKITLEAKSADKITEQIEANNGCVITEATSGDTITITFTGADEWFDVLIESVNQAESKMKKYKVKIVITCLGKSYSYIYGFKNLTQLKIKIEESNESSIKAVPINADIDNIYKYPLVTKEKNSTWHIKKLLNYDRQYLYPYEREAKVRNLSEC